MWRIQPAFSIELHSKDLALLKQIHQFAGVGTIRTRKRDDQVIYAVYSIKDIIKVIIPHFDKYPLYTQKQADFKLFKLVVEIMSRKEHLTTEGLHKILSIRASMNKGLTPELEAAFPNIKPFERPNVEAPEKIDPYWLAGFTEGEGCFHIGISQSETHNTGSQVRL